MMRWWPPVIFALLAGCATQPPTLPPPVVPAPAANISINPVGEWTALAFDGRPAGAADRFPLTITATWLRARLCNDVHGTYRLVGRRIEAVGPPWPRTERGCGAREQRLEERSWAVLDAARSPSITMLDPDRMRITSTSGSIDFERRR